MLWRVEFGQIFTVGNIFSDRCRTDDLICQINVCRKNEALTVFALLENNATLSALFILFLLLQIT